MTNIILETWVRPSYLALTVTLRYKESFTAAGALGKNGRGNDARISLVRGLSPRGCGV